MQDKEDQRGSKSNREGFPSLICLLGSVNSTVREGKGVKAFGRWKKKKQEVGFPEWQEPIEIGKPCKATLQICPGLKPNEMQAFHDRHHEVPSLIKVNQTTYNSFKYEVI